MMTQHRELGDHVCSAAVMTRGAWRTLIAALRVSAEIKQITDIRGQEELSFTNGTSIHVTIAKDV